MYGITTILKGKTEFGELYVQQKFWYYHVVGSLFTVSHTLIAYDNNYSNQVLQLLHCIVNKGHYLSYLLPTSLIGSTEC